LDLGVVCFHIGTRGPDFGHVHVERGAEHLHKMFPLLIQRRGFFEPLGLALLLVLGCTRHPMERATAVADDHQGPGGFCGRLLEAEFGLGRGENFLAFVVGVEGSAAEGEGNFAALGAGRRLFVELEGFLVGRFGWVRVSTIGGAALLYSSTAGCISCEAYSSSSGSMVSKDGKRSSQSGEGEGKGEGCEGGGCNWCLGGLHREDGVGAGAVDPIELSPRVWVIEGVLLTEVGLEEVDFLLEAGHLPLQLGVGVVHLPQSFMLGAGGGEMGAPWRTPLA
jgi:hypothetical protein